MAKRKTKRLKKKNLPGMEDLSIKEIDEAAQSYVGARDDRMDRLKEEVKLQDRLLGLMREHSLTTYKFDGYTVNVVAGDQKVKVKRMAEENVEIPEAE